MKEPAADLIMSLMLVAAVELARGGFRRRKGLLCSPGHSCIDRLAQKYGVIQQFMKLNRRSMTP
jgi:hypothetical protein